jgi:hypothetical protein
MHPTCVSRLRSDEKPLHRIGSLFGWFTLPRPILIPHYETRSRLTPAVL